MRISKTQDVNLSVSASWKVEKFSLLKLFKIIENEYTTLIPMTKDYRSVIVVCRAYVMKSNTLSTSLKNIFPTAPHSDP